MNTKLIKAIEESTGEVTIYFKNKTYNTNHTDYAVYLFISRFASISSEFEGSNKTEQYAMLTEIWYHLLVREKRQELGLGEKNDIDSILERAIKAFDNVTRLFTKKEKIEMLYKMPWHLRILLISSLGIQLNMKFVRDVSSLDKLDKMNSKETSYFMISSYDRVAINTLFDEIKEEHIDEIATVLTEDIHTFCHGFDDLNWLQEKILKENYKSNHAYNVLAYLLILHNEQERKDNRDVYIIQSLSSLCFWHLEATKISSDFYLKGGGFKHLKSVQKKLAAWSN